MMTTNEIRQSFIDFFTEHGHQHVTSASLIPTNDDTLLFTNAGMVQFKDVFLGADKRDYNKAVSVQKCVRAGGKHNDLENVGYTARHHTFFEMLGNFSFGDYFKRDAIFYAWRFLTEVLSLPKEKLWVTVYEKDQEAEAIWLNEIGVDPARFSKIGEKDNFWSMGDTGPCGPCTEIFYDHGESVAGGPPGTPEEDGDRYIEIWNLVFMQYNRLKDGTLVSLPNPSVDTGMGLERLAAVLQGVHSNYEIDTFQKLITAAAEIVGTKDINAPSLKVIADHIRACAFLVADGVLPSNEGRGYVLRRIIRRAARHGYKLGANDVFFFKLVNALVIEMGQAYPELSQKQAFIEVTLKQEEEQFQKTLSHGMKIFEQEISGLDGDVIPGKLAFKLYDTYGFPLDLTADIARERGLHVDVKSFDMHMLQQKNKAKSANKFNVDYNQMMVTDVKSAFVGYSLLVSDAIVADIYHNNQKLNKLEKGQDGVIILDKTPFYAESGGQIGDKGVIEALGATFEVHDTQKTGQAILHIGKVTKGAFAIDDEVTAQVNTDKRVKTALNHTATHLLHAALRQIVGGHLEQKGSLVEPGRLRFDFSNPSAVTRSQLKAVERLVNQVIRQNLAVETIETTPDHAKDMGAMALFGEKYGDIVRVLKVGDFSIELCGGTHVRQTGDIGFFKITGESGISAGIRRIEAVTGQSAENYVDAQEETLNTIHELLKSTDDNVLDKLIKLQNQLKEQDKQIKKIKSQLALGSASTLQEKIIDDTFLIFGVLDNVDMSVLRDKIDQYKAQKKQVIVALATQKDDKAQIAVGVSQSICAQVKAGELANFIAKQVDGKGGGRPDMAQAGGNNPQNLPNAMASVGDWVQQKLTSLA
ncbi:alanine--tRNA ligase [Facilibium subflavum]|uniref:alanine--tRNA ligase n=1 Tax=Facilibium subflavum TaxID=2219058 RepID=UPI000E64B780|nr:alanine--tRNA ligase [Facilibium subflavum]